MNHETRRKLLARVHIAKKWAEENADMSEADYRGLVAEEMAARRIRVPQGSRPSSAFLDEKGLRSLLDGFRRLGWPDGKGYRPPSAPPDARPADPPIPAPAPLRYTARGVAGDGRQWPTQAQLNYIAAMEDDLGWTSNPGRIRGLIKRQSGGQIYLVESMPRSLTTKVITALEILTGRKTNARSSKRKATSTS